MKLSKIQAVIVSGFIGIATLFILRHLSLREGMDGGASPTTTTTSSSTTESQTSTTSSSTTESATPSFSSTESPLQQEPRKRARHSSRHPRPKKQRRYWGSRGTGDGYGYYWNYPQYWSDFYGPPYILEPPTTQTIIVEQQPEGPTPIGPIGPIITLIGTGAVVWAILR